MFVDDDIIYKNENLLIEIFIQLRKYFESRRFDERICVSFGELAIGDEFVRWTFGIGNDETY